MANAQPHTSTPSAAPAPRPDAPTEAFTVTAMVRPREGALERVFGLLRRRSPSPSALNVSAGEGAEATRVTLTIHATRAVAEQVTEQLRKLVDVESATCFSASEASGAVVVRECALIRMRATPETRREIVDVARLFAARIVDVRDGSITLEASGPSRAIESILAMLRPLGVEEVARSGGLAIRGGVTTPGDPMDEEDGDLS